MQNKNAQFYLVAAIIIVIVIVGLSTITNYVITKKSPVKLYDLSQELGEEGARVIDYGSYKKEEIPPIIESFTNNFADYAGEQEADIEMVFIYGNESSLKAVRYTEESTGEVSIIYGTNTFTLPAKGEYVTIDLNPAVSGNKVSINLKGKTYSFDLKEGENFLFVLVKEVEGETYTTGSG